MELPHEQDSEMQNKVCRLKIDKKNMMQTHSSLAESLKRKLHLPMLAVIDSFINRAMQLYAQSNLKLRFEYYL